MTGALLILALSGTVDGWFERAGEAYHRGDFAEAASGYEHVIALGVEDPDLYYNLGTAYLRQGRVGHAVWAYERALVLAPNHEDAAWNLALARERASRRDKLRGETGEPLWMRAVTTFDRSVTSVVFLVVYFGLFASLLARRFVGRLGRTGFGAGAALFGASSLLLGLLVAGRYYHDRYVDHAIVLPDEVAVAEGPGDSARVAFRVHGGLKVRLVDTEAEWVRVRLWNGMEGWLRDRDVGRL